VFLNDIQTSVDFLNATSVDRAEASVEALFGALAA
jgi:hypothetical protein